MSTENLPAATARSEVFVPAELIRRCMGKVEFAQSIVERFLDRLTSEYAEMCAASELLDGQRLATVAHRLKGSAANMSAWRIQNVSSDLETLGQENRMAEAADRLTELDHEIVEFRKYLVSWRQTKTPLQ
jgi:two-component system, sensor histidine kinase and response regulator